MATNALIPYQIERELPFAVSSQLATLPEDYQKQFVREYNQRMKNVVVSYVLHFLFPTFQYLYVDKLLLQILFWFTGGGMGIWWFIDLFRIPGMTQERNREIADECLRRVMTKYNREMGIGPPQPSLRQRPVNQPPPLTAKPRQLSSGNYDPSKLSIEDAKVGYLVDYGLKTWKVVNQIQFDWADGLSEQEFKLNSETDIIYVSARRESALVYCYVSSIVNLYSIDKNFDSYVTENGAPPNVIQYADFTLYRDIRFEGIMFNQAYNNKPIKVVMWDYFDMTREYRLRVERAENGQFFAIFGKKVSDIEFSEVLPVSQD
ncbi:MAG: TM2 domain-containing protein [Bernardetiaceae bacterium]|jgi:hypothetical protein|nr:TM2 domain-containing protein [Bernardetiaceae bacterium]